MRACPCQRGRGEILSQKEGKATVKPPVIAILLPLLAGPAAAAPELPPIHPRPVLFSPAEVGEYEDAVAERTRFVTLTTVGSSVVALLAGGVTLLALGLKGEGSAALTTAGISCLSGATVGAFVGLDLIAW